MNLAGLLWDSSEDCLAIIIRPEIHRVSRMRGVERPSVVRERLAL